jgi:hypothetical protein
VHRILRSAYAPAVAQGSVFRKGTGWAFRVDAGYHAGSGKRRQTLKQGFPTKKAAQTALADARPPARGRC